MAPKQNKDQQHTKENLGLAARSQTGAKPLFSGIYHFSTTVALNKPHQQGVNRRHPGTPWKRHHHILGQMALGGRHHKGGIGHLVRTTHSGITAILPKLDPKSRVKCPHRARAKCLMTILCDHPARTRISGRSSLGSEDQHGAITSVLPQGMQEGDGGTVQQGRAPVAVLLLCVNQLQYYVQAAPRAEAEFLGAGRSQCGTGHPIPCPSPGTPLPLSRQHCPSPPS